MFLNSRDYGIAHADVMFVNVSSIVVILTESDKDMITFVTAEGWHKWTFADSAAYGRAVSQLCAALAAHG